MLDSKVIQLQHLNGKMMGIQRIDNEMIGFVSRSKNDRAITQDDRTKLNVSGNTVSMTISEVTLADAGIYELIAENGLGSVECSAKLTVNGMGK